MRLKLCEVNGGLNQTRPCDSRYFGMLAEFWLGLQMDYDLDVAEGEKADRIRCEVQVYGVGEMCIHRPRYGVCVFN